MKVLLAAVNAKYIHSNLAVHSLKAYARTYTEEIEVAEYTINQTFDAILQDIYRRKPDLLGISCYLWTAFERTAEDSSGYKNLAWRS